MNETDALIADINAYQHLLIGSKCAIALDGSLFQQVEGGPTLTVGREVKPGNSEIEVSAWKSLKEVDSFDINDPSGTELNLESSTYGGQVERVLSLKVNQQYSFTIKLKSVIREVLGMAFGAHLTAAGTFIPFKKNIFKGWVKLQSYDEAERLRLAMDAYCNFSVSGMTGKATEFTSPTLKCDVLKSTKNLLYTL